MRERERERERGGGEDTQIKDIPADATNLLSGVTSNRFTCCQCDGNIQTVF